MDISTKFNVGDNVYICVSGSSFNREKCDACNGAGLVFINKKEYKCPACHGVGFRFIGTTPRWQARKLIVDGIMISTGYNETDPIRIEYAIKTLDGNSYYYKTEDEIFESEQNAMAYYSRFRIEDNPDYFNNF